MTHAADNHPTYYTTLLPTFMTTLYDTVVGDCLLGFKWNTDIYAFFALLKGELPYDIHWSNQQDNEEGDEVLVPIVQPNVDKFFLIPHNEEQFQAFVDNVVELLMVKQTVIIERIACGVNFNSADPRESIPCIEKALNDLGYLEVYQRVQDDKKLIGALDFHVAMLAVTNRNQSMIPDIRATTSIPEDITAQAKGH